MTVNEVKNRHYAILLNAQNIQATCVTAFRQLDNIANNPSKADTFELYSIQTRLDAILKATGTILDEVEKMKMAQTLTIKE